jgi:hypothetical protein
LAAIKPIFLVVFYLWLCFDFLGFMFVPVDERLHLGGVNFRAAGVGGLWFATVFVGCVNANMPSVPE